jgi:nicotinamidase-related amidase
MLTRAISRIDPQRASLFVCDIQDKFLPLIYKMPVLMNRSALCINVARELEIPVIVTEQYSKVFGATAASLTALLPPNTPCFEKTKFSMMTSQCQEHFDGLSGRDQVIICGIEAHVCVMQTVLDLLGQGKEVHIVADALSSQRKHDRDMAMIRMQGAGAVITTSESLVLDLLRDSKHSNFKVCSGLLKVHNEQSTWEED